MRQCMIAAHMSHGLVTYFSAAATKLFDLE